MKIANIHDAKTPLSELVERALEGDEVVIARAGKLLVRMVPISQDKRPRQGGQWKNKVRVADDFDELPADFAAASGIEPRSF